MAGDWIKMRHDLASDPAVIGIAHITGLDEDAVVGKLHRLWSWADSQTIDGNAPSVTKTWIDRYLTTEGFADAMISVGWLIIRTAGISIPNFDRHISESAKKRALSAIRIAQHKARKGNAKGNADSVSDALPREEKRRVDHPPNPPPGGEGGSEGKIKERGNALDGLDAHFEAWWKEYPKKMAETAARRAWDELSPSDMLASELLAAVRRQKKNGPWSTVNFWPNPEKWLRDKRWKDKVSGDEPLRKPVRERASEQSRAARAIGESGGSKSLSDVLDIFEGKQDGKSAAQRRT